ncbi:MAG: hypothetical protein J0I09_04290 [Sphingobacteriia bacterium]|nr:hypothetical protein [Sphingobacteriia bacterium]
MRVNPTAAEKEAVLKKEASVKTERLTRLAAIALSALITFFLFLKMLLPVSV